MTCGCVPAGALVRSQASSKCQLSTRSTRAAKITNDGQHVVAFSRSAHTLGSRNSDLLEVSFGGSFATNRCRLIQLVEGRSRPSHRLRCSSEGEVERAPSPAKKKRGRKKKDAKVPEEQQSESDGKGELIFTLERFGHGWGEEILPRLDVKYASVRQGGATLPASNLEELLGQCGVPVDEVDRVLKEASTWRVTKGGRHLIDKRRRLRIKENLPDIFRLCASLGVTSQGFGQVVMAVPEILVSGVGKPWDRTFLIWACQQLKVCTLGTWPIQVC